MDTPEISPAAIGVRCSGIDVSYENVPIFRDFAVQFQAGLCTCLLGPSGCGKSTLLRIISGAKTIEFSGTIELSAEKKNSTPIAWMSQNDLLLPWLTVLDNVCLGAKLRGELNRDTVAKAKEMLEGAGMAGCEKLYPSALSGGMRQRVALLRTLMEESPILLMDEPFSALDALTRLRLQDLSARLTRGKTVLLVTHDPMEALRLGDRIIVLGGSPVRIAADVVPGGKVPRPGDDPHLLNEYPKLLQTLLSEGVQ